MTIRGLSLSAMFEMTCSEITMRIDNEVVCYNKASMLTGSYDRQSRYINLDWARANLLEILMYN